MYNFSVINNQNIINMSLEHPIPQREGPPKGATLQERKDFFQESLNVMLPHVANGKNRDILSEVGWPLYSLVKTQIGDINNSLGLVPQDIWDIYETDRERAHGE